MGRVRERALFFAAAITGSIRTDADTLSGHNWRNAVPLARIMKNYRRSPDPYPAWSEENCGESNDHVTITDEDYMLSAGGFLMPTRRNQAPPNLKYFKPTPK